MKRIIIVFLLLLAMIVFADCFLVSFREGILRDREPHCYIAAVSREQCARRERNDLLNRVYGGAAGDLIAAFLKESSISPKEIQRLKKLLEDMEV